MTPDEGEAGTAFNARRHAVRFVVLSNRARNQTTSRSDWVTVRDV